MGTNVAAERDTVLEEARRVHATRAPAHERVVSKLPTQRVSRDFVALANDVLGVYDFGIIAITGFSSRLAWDAMKYLTVPDPSSAALASSTAVIVAAVVAALLLRDRNLTTLVAFQQRSSVCMRLMTRFVMLVGVLLGIGFATRALDSVPRGWVALWSGLAFALLTLGRVLMAKCLGRLERGGYVRDVVAVVGAGAGADRLINHLKATRGAGIEVLGVFDDRQARHAENEIAPIGKIADLVHFGKQRRIDWVVLNLPVSAEQRITDTCFQIKALAASVALCPTWIGPRTVARSDLLCDELAVSVLVDRPLRGRNIVAKRLMDSLLGGALVLALAPVMACIAAAIALESRGPVLFRQTRLGWNNREFTILKFRTMRWTNQPVGAMVQTMRVDARVTRVGKFLRRMSLDELPQLFNVLKGEMSLVGPRPHAVDMTTQNLHNYEIVREYAHRHRVKPGITGWAQVNGYRGATRVTAELTRRVEFDLYYVENWSLAFDLKILFRTLLIAFGDRNAF